METNEEEPTEPVNDRSSINGIYRSTPNSEVPCPHCGKFYTSSRGIAIHISKSHPEIHREKLVQRQKHNSSYSIWNTNKITGNSSLDTTENITSIKNPLSDYKTQLNIWKDKFNTEVSDTIFDSLISEFLKFLSEAIDLLPGPKHPAHKYYELSKNINNLQYQRSYKHSSNPRGQQKEIR